MSEKQKKNEVANEHFAQKTDGELLLGMVSKEFANILDRNRISIKNFYTFCAENKLNDMITVTRLEKMRSAPNNSYKKSTEIPPFVVKALIKMLGRDLLVALRDDYRRKNLE